MNYHDAVDDREKGQIPITIGTSLALEGAFGIYPDRPESPPPLRRAKELWINVRTLIRNMFNALPTDVRDGVTAHDLWMALIEETVIIQAAIVKESEGRVQTVFYACDYSNLSRDFPHALFKALTTPKQVAYQSIERELIHRLQIEHALDADLRFFKWKIRGQYPESFIITHQPVDLLAKHEFRRLELLESHTGVVKPATQWHTKLTGGKELSFLPFNEFTLQVFGDNGMHFSPQVGNLRKAVIALAHERSWTVTTTMEKIRFGVAALKDSEIRGALSALL